MIKETAICERKVTSIRATFKLSQLASALKRDLYMHVYDRSKTFSFIIVFSTVVFSSRKLVFFC